MKDTVAEAEALPIDGIWTITSLGKRIRIGAGRAWAVDPWLHMFVLRVQPGMVVMQNFQRMGSGRYTGDDLPLVGKFQGTLKGKSLDLHIAGALGPVNLTLVPVELDNPEWFARELAGSGNEPPSLR